MGQAACFKWFAKFKSGRQTVDDDNRPGRPVSITSESNVIKIHQEIDKDRRQTIRDVAKATKPFIWIMPNCSNKETRDATSCGQIRTTPPYTGTKATKSGYVQAFETFPQ